MEDVGHETSIGGLGACRNPHCGILQLKLELPTFPGEEPDTQREMQKSLTYCGHYDYTVQLAPNSGSDRSNAYGSATVHFCVERID